MAESHPTRCETCGEEATHLVEGAYLCPDCGADADPEAITSVPLVDEITPGYSAR